MSSIYNYSIKDYIEIKAKKRDPYRPSALSLEKPLQLITLCLTIRFYILFKILKFLHLWQWPLQYTARLGRLDEIEDILSESCNGWIVIDSECAIPITLTRVHSLAKEVIQAERINEIRNNINLMLTEHILEK